MKNISYSKIRSVNVDYYEIFYFITLDEVRFCSINWYSHNFKIAEFVLIFTEICQLRMNLFKQKSEKVTNYL